MTPTLNLRWEVRTVQGFKYVRGTYGTVNFKGTYRTGPVKYDFLGKMSTFSKRVQYLQFLCNRVV